jgi:histidine triad (HIT) family protein
MSTLNSNPTLFTKIINGQIPCYKIFEDDLTFAFLDIHPHRLGHTLIVPKAEIGHLLDIPEPLYSRLFQNAKLIGKAIQKATNCEKIGLLVNGMGVKDHFHLHIIPLFAVGDTDGTIAGKLDPNQATEIQTRIIAELAKT